MHNLAGFGMFIVGDDFDKGGSGSSFGGLLLLWACSHIAHSDAVMGQFTAEADMIEVTLKFNDVGGTPDVSSTGLDGLDMSTSREGVAQCRTTRR